MLSLRALARARGRLEPAGARGLPAAPEASAERHGRPRRRVSCLCSHVPWERAVCGYHLAKAPTESCVCLPRAGQGGAEFKLQSAGGGGRVQAGGRHGCVCG